MAVRRGAPRPRHRLGACPRGDWLLWLAGRCATPGSPGHRAVVAAAADCAEAVLELAPPDEARPRRAVEAARAWARGEATAAECSAAYAAAAAAAADAADADAYVAPYPPANAAARAAYAAAAGRCVDFAAIVRRHIPNPPSL